MFKLLALDVPSAAGPEQRIYLEGDEKIYNRGSVIRELRDPFLNVSLISHNAGQHNIIKPLISLLNLREKWPCTAQTLHFMQTDESICAASDVLLHNPDSRRILRYPASGRMCVSVTVSVLVTYSRNFLLVQALSMRETYEAEDELDDAVDDAHEAQERRSRQLSTASSSALGQGMYFYERVYWGEELWPSALSCRLDSRGMQGVHPKDQGPKYFYSSGHI